MTDYLTALDFDWDTLQMATDYDQNSSWSPYFGELIFTHVPLRKELCVLDVGCGTGYPTIELSQRLGNTSHVYGIDVWKAALERAQHKVDRFGITNVTLQNEDAASMSFQDEMFDLIVSNVGINNFESSVGMFRECFRVSKPGALLAVTTNPVGHMAEFYEFFKSSLKKLQLDQYIGALEQHIAHRRSLEPICNEIRQSGFEIKRVIDDSFTWRFLNGTAFLNTFHIIYGFLPGWKDVLPEELHIQVFSEIEAEINQFSDPVGEFKVTVPMHYIEAERPMV